MIQEEEDEDDVFEDTSDDDDNDRPLASTSLTYGQYQCMMERLECRTFASKEWIVKHSDATAPALYIVLHGTVKLQRPTGGFQTKEQSVKIFGKELLDRAEFRKTAAGKLIESLVTAPYRYENTKTQTHTQANARSYI